jgi:hypothetical protein
MMRRTVFLSVVLMLSPLFLIGQITVGEFINSAKEDYEVKTFEEQALYLDKKPYRLSPLKELEYRHRNSELLDTENRVGLRVTPANPWEMRANNQYYKNYSSGLALQKELALRDAISSRYFIILDFLYYSELKVLTSRSQKMLAEQLSILQAQSQSRFFDAKEFAKLKVEELNYEVEFEEFDFEISNQVHRMERLYPKMHGRKIEWSLGDFISVEQVKTVVDSMVRASVKSTLLAYEQQKILTAQSQYKVEKYNWNVGFIQGMYDQGKAVESSVPFVLSFGITIPVTNPNKPDITRRKLQVIEAENDLKESNQESDRDKVILQDKLASTIEQYISLKQKIETLQNSGLAQRLSTIEGGDPLVYVQVNERIARLETLLVKIKHQVYLTYVEYLGFTDRIQNQPLVNYLSPVLDSIEK